MIDNRKTIHDIFIVTLSNVFTIISGIVGGFILPKIFTVEEYGLYKTFTLYTSYMGLLNLGIADGIVLKYGGYDYNGLDRPRFRSYFKWYELVHLILCGIMLIIGVLSKGESQFILIALAINTIIINTICYFQQISQITQRFKEYSMRKIIQAVSSIIIAGIILIIFNKTGYTSYKLYLGLCILFSIFFSFWYFATYKDIIFGNSLSIRESIKDIKGFIISGFPLLFANLCSTLILTLDRQFVNLLFPTSYYAVYAFAYNMLSMVTVATSAASAVLFPTLKRANTDNLSNSYTRLIGIMLVFVYAAMIGYYPLYVFINWFLPKYSQSLVIFRIIFPGLAISSCVTVIMHNYYKVLGLNLIYFKKSLLILLISGVTNGIAYLIFKTPASISIASIITMVIWYAFTERYFINEYGVKYKNNLAYLLIMASFFYFITEIHNIYISGVIYILAFLIVTFLLKHNTIMDIIKYLRGK